MKNLWRILKGLSLILIVLSLVIAVLFGYRDIPTEEIKLKYAQMPSSFGGNPFLNLLFCTGL